MKPPHLAEVGLYSMPTLVNNVESFASVPQIINMGGKAFQELGVEDSGGTKLICLSGNVVRRGTFEVPIGGVNLRDGMKVAVACPGAMCRWHGAEMLPFGRSVRSNRFPGAVGYPL